MGEDKLRDRVQLREQVGQLTAMLKAERELRAQDWGKIDAQGREPQKAVSKYGISRVVGSRRVPCYLRILPEQTPDEFT